MVTFNNLSSNEEQVLSILAQRLVEVRSERTTGKLLMEIDLKQGGISNNTKTSIIRNEEIKKLT